MGHETSSLSPLTTSARNRAATARERLLMEHASTGTARSIHRREPVLNFLHVLPGSLAFFGTWRQFEVPRQVLFGRAYPTGMHLKNAALPVFICGIRIRSNQQAQHIDGLARQTA